MRKYHNQVIDQYGNPVAGASVYVYLAGTSTLATLWADEGKTTTLNNPLTTDSLGRFAFYVDNGDYDLHVVKTGVVDWWDYDVTIVDPKDKVNKAGDTMTGPLTLSGDPTQPLHAATKQYADSRGSWKLLAKVIPATNTTSIVISGLSLSLPVVLRIGGVIYNSLTVGAVYAIRLNGETSSSNWNRQWLYADGTALTANRELGDSYIAGAGAGTPTAFTLFLASAQDGEVRGLNVHQLQGPRLTSATIQKNTAVTSITQIEIIASQANGIGAGSVIFVEQLL